jgi:hypothetical protein
MFELGIEFCGTGNEKSMNCRLKNYSSETNHLQMQEYIFQ